MSTDMSTELSGLSDVYAVIRSGGKQYRVSPGQRLKLERLDGKAGDQVTFSDVLLVRAGGQVAVGAPTVDSASVSGEIIEQGRGRKINVFKYKNKTRYRRLRGHRQLHTAVLVNQVSLGDQTWKTADAQPQTNELEEPDADSDSIREPSDESTTDPTELEDETVAATADQSNKNSED